MSKDNQALALVSLNVPEFLNRPIPVCYATVKTMIPLAEQDLARLEAEKAKCLAEIETLQASIASIKNQLSK